MPQYNLTLGEALSAVGLTPAPGRAGQKADRRGDVFTSCPQCPTHDAGHLNIFTGKFHCFSCGLSVGDIFANRPDIARGEGEPSPVVEQVEEDPEASPETKDKCFRAMIADSMFSMDEKGYQWLSKRGITKRTAQLFGLRFYPNLDPCKDYERRVSLARRIQREGVTTKGVPAFATDKKGNRYLCQKGGEGILLPVKNVFNQVVSLRFKPLVKRDGAKETPLSTAGKPGGCSAHSPVGVYCDWKERKYPANDAAGEIKFSGEMTSRAGTFCVTEGPLKAIIMRQEWPEAGPVLALSGVSTVRGLWDTLVEMKRLGFTSCENFLDMDEFIPFIDKYGVKHPGNEGVISASKELKRMCGKLNLRYIRRKWNREIKLPDGTVVDCLKGIDDMLVWKNHKIIPHTVKAAAAS